MGLAAVASPALGGVRLVVKYYFYKVKFYPSVPFVLPFFFFIPPAALGGRLMGM